VKNGLSKYGRHARARPARRVFDPDLEQGGDTNIAERSDLVTGEMTRILVHPWCRPGRPRGRPRMCWPMLEPPAGNLHVRC
jgi:hypothetical protein